jgi:hypothetical protein
MASDRSILERQMERVELRPFTLEGFHRRRQRKQRNRRVGTAVVALAVAAVGIGGLARAFLSGPGPRPADQPPSRFLGEWASTNHNDYVGADNTYSQTMTIRAGEEGVLHITVHDDSSIACSDTPASMTGTGRLEDPTTLVVPSPVLSCDDGSDIRDDGVFPELKGELNNYTLVLDPATDRLYDSLGAVWNRGAPPENWAGRSTEAGVDGPGTFAILHGEVTFRAAEPWIDHAEAYIDPRLFFLVGPGGRHLVGPGGRREPAGISILVNPLPPETPCDSLRVPASAEELVQAIRSNPDLEATAPVTERVGGIDALRMDVVAAPGASPGPCSEGGWVPVVSVPGRGAWGGVELGRLGRLYVLDLPGGSARTLAILITAPDAALFERALEAAAPVLDSFEFHAG